MADSGKSVSFADCRIVRSQRASCRLEVRNGEVLVRLPLRAPLRWGEELLEKHRNWVEEKLAEQRRKITPPLKLEFGVELPLFDRRYPLKAGARRGFDNGFYLLPEDDEHLPEKLRLLYRALAKVTLGEKLGNLAREHSLKYRDLKISSAKGRWGSCSGNGSINLCWRLLLLPERLCSCVILHELAHLDELNHSPRFYAKFAELCPQWKSLSAELKNYSGTLDNWI